MAKLKFHKVTSLPAVPGSHELYFLNDGTNEPSIHVTDSSGSFVTSWKAGGLTQADIDGGIDITKSVESPGVNLFYNSGTLGDNILAEAGVNFNGNGELVALNGVTVSFFGSFVNDNSTNGGAGGALTGSAADFLTGVGRTGDDARYGLGFNIAGVTVGVTGITDITVNGTNYAAVFESKPTGAASVSSGGRWVKVTLGTAVVAASAKDNVPVSNPDANGVENIEITVADGWTYISENFSGNKRGVHTYFKTYLADSSTIETCLLSIHQGNVYTPKELAVAPIPSLDAVFTL